MSICATFRELRQSIRPPKLCDGSGSKSVCLPWLAKNKRAAMEWSPPRSNSVALQQHCRRGAGRGKGAHNAQNVSQNAHSISVRRPHWQQSTQSICRRLPPLTQPYTIHNLNHPSPDNKRAQRDYASRKESVRS